MANAFKIIGIGLLFFGVVGVGVELDNLSSGESKNPVLGFMLAGSFLLAAAGAFKQSRKHREKAEKQRAEQLERTILGLARANGWKLTAAEVAAQTPLTVADATAELDRLAKHGACEVEFGKGTALIYEFPAPLPNTAD